MNVDLRELLPILPAILFSIAAVFLMISEATLRGTQRGYQAVFAAIAALVGGLPAVRQLGEPPRFVFGGVLTADAFSGFVVLVVSAGLFLAVLASATFLSVRQVERGEYYALLHFGAAGMSIVAAANDLMMIFIGIEVMSIATYALAGYLRRGTRPPEAALKYFLLGAFSSGLFLFGTALIYGATRSTGLSGIARAASADAPFGIVGLVLLIAGFGFKIAAVPLHMWAPDVYEGAPTPVTAYMAAGVKAAAFAALLRTMEVAFAGGKAVDLWLPLIFWLAVITMVAGNLLALPQRNVKRMLAYSSVAHAGYLLVGICAANLATARTDAGEGLLFYLAAYTVSVVGAFSALASVERHDGESTTAWDLDRFTGLGRRRPFVALAASIFMLSLAGIPPTVGFPAKILLFKAAVEANLVPLAVVGIVTSAVGAYYYLRVVVYMYMREAEHGEAPSRSGWGLDLALALAGVLVVVLGVGPSALADVARASGITFGG